MTQTPDLSYTSDTTMRTIPPEQALLEMKPERIYQIFKETPEFDKALNAIRQGKVTKEQAFQRIKMLYPNFPKEKFDQVWDLMQNDLKKESN